MTTTVDEAYKKRKLHIETCKRCGGLCANYGSDGWMCSSCWASCCGPDSVDDDEEEEEGDEYSGWGLSKKEIASLKRERRKEEQKEAKARKKQDAYDKKEKKLFTEIIFDLPITKARNLQLQKILQNQEYNHGKWARAVMASDCLAQTLKRYTYSEDSLRKGEEHKLFKRIKFLKTMSVRAGDIYEYKWD